MKRRNFLAASAILTFLASTPVLGAKKKSAATKAKAASSQRKGKSTGKAGKAGKSRTRRRVSARTAASSRPSAANAAPEDTSAANTPIEHRNVVKLPQEKPTDWHTVELQTDVGLQSNQGRARLWLPLAQYKDTDWQRTIGHTWQGNFSKAGIYRDPVADMEIFFAEWPESIDTPKLQFITQIATQNRQFDITRRGVIAEQAEVLRRNLHPTQLAPVDGIVHQTAERAIGRIKDPLAMGKALYDWVIENASFDTNGQGMGEADISQLLGNGRFVGRSADIALLFVALCRSVGIPARPVYGLRTGRSRLFNSLGATGELRSAQHCRAEFYIPGYSWIGVDPAAVCEAIREEPLSNTDPKVNVFKKLLFGFWEMNWIGFNTAQDVILQGASGKALPSLIYPVAETAGGRFDGRNTNRMTYRATANHL